MNKQIKLLKKQIAKLDDKDFDLEVWKISTRLLLEKIFGKNSSEIKQINEISGDMSSWTLRDNLGDNKSDRSKLLGKQILETCIDELEISENEITGDSKNDFMDLLKDELKGAQFKQINEIVSSNETSDGKYKKLLALFKKSVPDDFLNALSIFLSK